MSMANSHKRKMYEASYQGDSLKGVDSSSLFGFLRHFNLINSYTSQMDGHLMFHDGQRLNTGEMLIHFRIFPVLSGSMFGVIAYAISVLCLREKRKKNETTRNEFR